MTVKFENDVGVWEFATILNLVCLYGYGQLLPKAKNQSFGKPAIRGT